MSLIILTFFLIYSGMNLYLFLKARAAFAFGAWTNMILIPFMLVMIFAPLIINLLQRQGFDLFARVMSYLGYIWLGILFLFLSSSILIDIYHSAIHVSGFMLNKDFESIRIPALQSFLFPLFISLSIAVYGYFEAKDIRTENLVVRTQKIPKETGKLKIVQISDVHIGLIIREERLRRILEKVKEAEPDILVSTGDLVDGQINRLEGLAELMREVNPRYGKFAITGNHEFYAGLPQALDFTEKAGFMMLRGNTATAADLINIAGVDDPQGKAYGQYADVSEKDLLSGLPRERFTLLLKHRPLIDRASVGLFDLQLSGHVHKGQIFPFSIITWLYYPVHAGCLNPVDRCFLYVSRGAGTWGPPIRFLSPPEITIIELIHED